MQPLLQKDLMFSFHRYLLISLCLKVWHNIWKMTWNCWLINIILWRLLLQISSKFWFQHSFGKVFIRGQLENKVQQTPKTLNCYAPLTSQKRFTFTCRSHANKKFLELVLKWKVTGNREKLEKWRIFAINHRATKARFDVEKLRFWKVTLHR